jgi:hypothetical protein
MGITELRTALQSLIPEEQIFERAVDRKKLLLEKVQKGKKLRRRFSGIFSCFYFLRKRGYRTIDEPDIPKYPVSDLSVSV